MSKYYRVLLGSKNAFIITVKTDNAGTSGTNQFTIPTIDSGYAYTIQTSDGQTITGNNGNKTITFPTAGTYDVKITGNFPRIYFNNGGDKLKITKTKNFGIYGLGSTDQSYAFYGCSNMVISATDAGRFENVTSIAYLFRNCTSLVTIPLLNFSNVISPTQAFRGCLSFTTLPLLNLSNVSDVSYVFEGTKITSFPKLNISASESFIRAWNDCNSLNEFPPNMFDTNSATNYSQAFGNTNLSTQSIDNILVSIDTSGVINGVFSQSGGSNAPSAKGLTAKSNLIAKGWTVTTN
jgi:hypothetical protein